MTFLARRLGGSTGATGLALAALVAIGIGVHNLGEGLAIGASFAIGELTLGSFLIVGFMIHNVTEGLGIAAPAAEGQAGDARPARRAWRSSPARPPILGAWIGGYGSTDVLTVLFFAGAAGAALEVVVEVGRYVARRAPGGLTSGWAIGGFLAGVAVMYVDRPARRLDLLSVDPALRARHPACLRRTGATRTRGNDRMRKGLGAAVVVLALFGVLVATAGANHSWNGYHWARTSNPFTLQLGDNVSGLWDGMLDDGGRPTGTARSTCTRRSSRAGRGRRTVGRLPVASRSAALATATPAGSASPRSGSAAARTSRRASSRTTTTTSATRATSTTTRPRCSTSSARRSDTPSGSTTRTSPAISLNTCMDYYHNTSASDVLSTHPNKHDYDELDTIYTHTDSTSTVGGSAGFLPDAVPSFARANEVSHSKYVQDLGNGRQLVTWVYWAV